MFQPGSLAPVVVSVLTFRRNELLRALLPPLTAQVAALDRPARVVVVDNDPQAGARAVVAEHQLAEYVHEPEPGIAAARNRAIDTAIESGAAALVFIDDDETPEPGWLAELVRVWQQTSAGGVGGPVLSTFEQPPSEWVVGSGFFAPRPHADGARLPAAATNNLLLDVDVLRKHHLRFDAAFGLTGGSDSLLTRQLVASGATIVWTTAAVVTETVPSQRATKAWVRRRHLRTGNGSGRVALAMANGAKGRLLVRLRLILTGVRRAVRGVTGWVVGAATRDVRRRATGECDLATAAGVLMSVVGRTRTEYRR